MIPFEKCPVCGGELETKQVEKLLRGGDNTVSLKVTAAVCQHCGERLYAEDVVRSFEDIRTKLRKQEFVHLKPVSRSFTVDKDWPNKAIQPPLNPPLRFGLSGGWWLALERMMKTVPKGDVTRFVWDTSLLEDAECP